MLFGIFVFYVPSEIHHKQNVLLESEKILRRITEDELDKEKSRVIVRLQAEKYFQPYYTPKVVGVTIKNLEKHDLADIFLKLIELKQSQYDKHGEFVRSIQIRLDKSNRNFELGEEATINADDEKVIKLAEIADTDLQFLLKKPLKPGRILGEQQPGVYISNPIWELIFELHGKINGNNFRKEVFVTQIISKRVMRKINDDYQNYVTIDIGEIFHVKQE